MLATSALLAILAAVASARNPINGIDHYFGPEQPLSNQCAPQCKAGDSHCHGKPRVCPVQLGDFHYLCGEYDYLEAAEACAKKGWRLAVLNEQNRRDGYDNMAQCLLIGGEAAWISNYLGQDADPCAILLRSGGVLMGLGQQACSKRRLGALCQDIPVKTLTASTTISTVTSSGVSTVTETVTKCKPHHHHNHCHNHCHKPECHECCHEKAEGQEKTGADAERCPHGNCAPVCPFKLGDIRIIQKNSTPFDAAKECERYGWTLLDLTVGRMNDFAQAAKACSFGEQNLWINSFNGVASPCLNSFGAKYSNVVPVGYPVIDEWCAIDNMFYVACQRGCQAHTGDGPYSGLIGKTVTTTTSSVVFTVPSATVTVTTTQWRKDSSSSHSSSSCSSSSSSDSSSSDSWSEWCSSNPTDPSCSSSDNHHRRRHGRRHGRHH